MASDHYTYEFTHFRLDPEEHLLLNDGVPVPLTSKTFQLLLVLVRNSGHLVAKSAIVSALWGDTFVEEGNLTVTVSMLRKALGDQRAGERYIETVSKRGYRFLPPVTRVLAPPPATKLVAESIATAEAPAETPPLPPPPSRSLSWLTPLAVTSLVAIAVSILAVALFLHASQLENPTAIPLRSPTAERASDPNALFRNPEALQLYQEGRFFWNKRTEQGFRRSIELFQRAVLKDPSYADAYAGLADSYTLLASYGIEPEQEAYPNAKAAAIKALQLNDGLAEAHTSLGMVALYYEWDWGQADHEFQRAIQLNPKYPLAHTWDALYFAAMGQMPQALTQAHEGYNLAPVALMSGTELGRVYYWDRQFDKAVQLYRHAIELDPYFARAHTRLGMALIAQKDCGEALHEFQEAKRLSGTDPYIDGLIGYTDAQCGKVKEATKVLTDTLARSKEKYVPAFSVALIYVGLGEKDQAMDWLDRAYKDRSTYMVYAKVDPLLDPLRSSPRFAELMRRMNFAELPGPGLHIETLPSGPGAGGNA